MENHVSIFLLLLFCYFFRGSNNLQSLGDATKIRLDMATKLMQLQFYFQKKKKGSMGFQKGKK